MSPEWVGVGIPIYLIWHDVARCDEIIIKNDHCGVIIIIEPRIPWFKPGKLLYNNEEKQ